MVPRFVWSSESYNGRLDSGSFEYPHTLKQLVKYTTEKETRRLLASMVQWLTPAMRAEPLLVSARTGTGLWDLLDALVVLLYQVDAYVSVIEDGFSVES